MAINFNVDPYYDDFDPSKNYHRILFKPGYAVQARELTQSQTILQNQITSFADNIFKQNSPVTGGQVTTNFNCYYVKLQTTYNNVNVDVSQFLNKLVTNASGNVVARVIAVVDATGTAGAGDPPTLILSYKSGVHFVDNEVVYDVDSNLAAQAQAVSSSGLSSVASISQGVFYISSSYTDPVTGLNVSNGIFSQVNPSTIVLSKYDNTPSIRIGLTIDETIIDYINDSSLLDPALGASNYQAPGADRYLLSVTLDTRPLAFGDDQNFIELVRVEDGNVYKMVDGSVYAVIDDYFAKRDYETNGDYVVSDFKLTPKLDPEGNTTYLMNVGKGLAYVRGYRTENPSPVDIVSDRARTTDSVQNDPIYMSYGNYFYVSNMQGTANGFFDVTTEQSVDLHCVPSSNVSFASANAYNSTLVSSGYVRGLVYDHNTTDTLANTFVYKLYVNDLQNSTLSCNAISSTSNTVNLASWFSSTNNAYVGVNLSVTKGTDAGDFKTITAYNGVTKVATVNSSWAVNPDSTSVVTLNFGVKDIETSYGVAKTANNVPTTVYSTASIDPTGKSNGLSTGDTILENSSTPELLFKVGNPYVQSISDASYVTTHEIRGVAFTASGGTLSAQIAYTGSYLGIVEHIGTPGSPLSGDTVKANYTIVVTNKGTNTKINNGDIIPWTITANTSRSVILSSDLSTATFSTSITDLTAFTATVVAKAFVSNAVDTSSNVILKYKQLISGNTSTVYTSGTAVNTYTHVDDSTNSTGQIYIQNAGIVAPGSKQSLYLSDVFQIVKIIDTGSSGTAPTTAMLTNPVYDVTRNFIFDNGQRDNYYDHASITLAPGAPSVKGNLLVIVDYFKHSGGDGYFSVASYPTTVNGQDFYRQIPTYVSQNGTYYNLRDSLDYRPARLNAQSELTFRYSNYTASTYGLFLPVDGTIYTCDYAYYLARKDKLVITKDRSIQIIEGAPSLNPILPTEPTGSLVIANITHNPYTGYLPTEIQNGMADLSVEKVQHRRYTMSDIAGLDARIGQIEYYTAMSALEQSTVNQQVTDAYGLNRFKNGIMTDDFSSFSTGDTANIDWNASINKRTRQMTSLQNVENYPMKNLALAYNLSSPSQSLLDSLNYKISTDGLINFFSLPYTSANLVSQKIASRFINVNPFSVSSSQGVVALTPNVDNWVDKNYAPSLLITDPNLQVFQASSQINTLSVGDWQTVSGTTVLSGSSSASTSSTVNRINHGAFWGPYGHDVGTSTRTVTTSTTNTYTTTLQQQQNNILGPYSSIGNTYSQNNGYITDISILPWMRPQEIVVRTSGLLFNSPLYNFFDNISVDNYIRKPNIIELTSVSGSFSENDVIGYVTSGTFHPTAVVLGVHVYNNGNVRLYVAADGNTTTYNNTGTLISAAFNSDGSYSQIASGSVSGTGHFGGTIKGANTSISTITFSPLASSTNNYYTGNTVYIVSGDGIGTNATITGYNGTTKTANLSSTLSTSNGSIYSIGSFSSNEDGNYFGVFALPPSTFHNGQRVFRVDNRINGNIQTVTTYAEGTFYSEGLQTTAQQIDFGASPAGAKGTFVQTNNRAVSYTTTTKTVKTAQYVSPYDPVAQTFIIDATNFPNGAFLSSVKFYFQSKPTTDKSPITLSIVGTLNGYPNGSTLDHSIVTLTPDKVVTSQSPQYLDPTAYTQFTFPSPVYIQSGVMYAFILKSNSSEYNVWSASNGDTALSSSVKNLPSDPTPTNITKIATAPYVGAVFISQNSQTWTPDQNQSLMFTIDRCVFDTTVQPTIAMVVPKKLPNRTIVEQSIDYYNNANSVANTVTTISNYDVPVDAFNVTTTDFVPTSTNINYTYSATLLNGTQTSPVNINPGKYGTSMFDHIYLNDNNGERLLQANSTSSFILDAVLTSSDDAVSPIISDAGVSLYAVQYLINNCPLSNNIITVTSGGTGYNANTTSVTISSPTGKSGVQAYASANVVGGVVQSIIINTNGEGAGYITTPTITITDANTTPGTGATAIVVGETSSHGGPAATKYFTKKVVLDAGFDSGDLNVYVTAYRPVNTDINVYYKILNRQDNQKFEDGFWQLMTKTQNSDSLYSQDRTDLHEYSFAPGTSGVDQGYITYTSTTGQVYTTFSQFAIKIVLTSTDKTYVPFLNDLRAIALPANVNTTA